MWHFCCSWNLGDGVALKNQSAETAAFVCFQIQPSSNCLQMDPSSSYCHHHRCHLRNHHHCHAWSSSSSLSLWHHRTRITYISQLIRSVMYYSWTQIWTPQYIARSPSSGLVLTWPTPPDCNLNFLLHIGQCWIGPEDWIHSLTSWAFSKARRLLSTGPDPHHWLQSQLFAYRSVWSWKAHLKIRYTQFFYLKQHQILTKTGTMRDNLAKYTKMSEV